MEFILLEKNQIDAILAAQILGLTRSDIAKNVADFRTAQTEKVSSKNIPGHEWG